MKIKDLKLNTFSVWYRRGTGQEPIRGKQKFSILTARNHGDKKEYNIKLTVGEKQH